MPDSKSPDDLEKERIAAWRAERARIAEADKAMRLAQRNEEKLAAEQQVEDIREEAARAIIRDAAPREGANATPPSPSQRKTKMWYSGRSKPILMTLAPVAVASFYLFGVATPLYEAQSVIAISKSGTGQSGNGDGIFGGLQRSANLSDVFLAHAYIKSQAMMDSLEAQTGFISDLSGDGIDPLRRLRDISLLSYSKVMQFDRFVETSVDIQSGLLTLYVRAPSKAKAIEISEAVLQSTENQVNTLGTQIFDRRQTNVVDTLEMAQAKLTQAQADLVALQINYQEADPRNRIESIYAGIRDLEAQAQELNSAVQKAQIAGVGNSAQTNQTIELEQRVRDKIQEERAKLVTPIGSNEVSLNTLLIEFELANLKVSLAQDAVKTALAAQSQVEQEAALNRSLFQVVVPPRTAETAIYPKSFGTLALVFLMSLTLAATLSLFRNRNPF